MPATRNTLGEVILRGEAIYACKIRDNRNDPQRADVLLRRIKVQHDHDPQVIEMLRRLYPSRRQL